ncbi:MAG: DNA mismatch repair protein MutS [Clostridiaceae bacterium]|nr:DNA mismatch repair protein MutS [Clostridiaceae bacterium]
MESKLTPMMVQYKQIKEKYKDCILFFRLGDFYEMFFDDAIVASKELEITLTGRNCGFEERAPMCGVPFHSADSYIARLVEKGYKVAICEQTEDPKKAVGIVDRDVIRVITPGTITDLNVLEDKTNRYMMAIYKQGACYGLCTVDTGTGECYSTQIVLGATKDKVINEAARFMPVEVIVNSEAEFLKDQLQKVSGSYVYKVEDSLFSRENAITRLKEQFKNVSDDLSSYHIGANAAGALLLYLDRLQKVFPKHIDQLNLYEYEGFMGMDVVARRNLELTETLLERKKTGSLLWVIDRTVTAMGGRMLRSWLEQPLTDVLSITERQNAVQCFKDNFIRRAEIRELLSGVYDMERITSKAVLGSVNCRDLLSVKNSFGPLPAIAETMKDFDDPFLQSIRSRIDTLEDLYDLLDRSINEQPPVTITEGGIIKDGYLEKVDKLRDASSNGKKWIADLQEQEREKTGIKNLKIGYNKVFGYYIEVSKSNIKFVPDRYIRKQTLVNCERYITQELKEMEEEVTGAEEHLKELEYELFQEIRQKVVDAVKRIKETSKMLAMLDALASLAETADRENYCKPEVYEGDEIIIKDGRHPVVEKTMKDTPFVPNDTLLDTGENRLNIITGPNMAGKSTYLRQVAITVILAQMGSFIPASYGKIGIVDKIFTRVGASDNLGMGQSTFMVEMVEMANIIKNATPKSLLILDEVGRGTSTFDGLSIAWAVVEYINDKEFLGCRTLFATHYHELTDLEDRNEGIKNYRVTAREQGDDIVFLRKIERGGADESYGIQVARLAGIPHLVISRAKEILAELENANMYKKRLRTKKDSKPIEGQMDILAYNNRSRNTELILKKLRETDVQNMTPLEALNLLFELSTSAKQT